MTSFFLRYLSIINTSIIWEELEWASALDPVESAESAASAASAVFTYYLRGIAGELKMVNCLTTHIVSYKVGLMLCWYTPW